MTVMPIVALLIIIGGVGLYWFYREKSLPRSTQSQLHHDYFRGLNYLINEQSDKAIDVFIRLLEVDTDTVDMHLALGNLFRQRGEVDRAIRIHQNLIARPQLEKRHRLQALAALGEDYFRAGVLDRAEQIFLDLAQENKHHQKGSHFLLMIYQQEKEWLKAIEVVKKMGGLQKIMVRTLTAQFYCELALQMKVKQLHKDFLDYLKRALAADVNCVRANLIKGDDALENKDYVNALRYYLCVKNQDASYMTEVIVSVVQCYEALKNDAALKQFLMECLSNYPSDKVVFAISHYLQRTENSKVAIAFLMEQIQHTPSLRGLTHLVDLYVLNSDGDTKEKLLILKRLIQAYIEGKPLYQCHQCGFSTQSLIWLCPSCHQWVTIKPMKGLEGVINEERLVSA